MTGSCDMHGPFVISIIAGYACEFSQADIRNPLRYLLDSVKVVTRGNLYSFSNGTLHAIKFSIVHLFY